MPPASPMQTNTTFITLVTSTTPSAGQILRLQEVSRQITIQSTAWRIVCYGKRRKTVTYSVYRLASNGELEQITDKSQYPERLYYYNYGFYDSADALKKAIGIDNLTTISMDVYQVRQFEKGEDGYRCYYNYWIRHLDNYKPTVMGVMEFGIVRNNLYRLRITNIADLGQPNLHIDPDTPDEGEALIKVVLNVKPWIVRDLTHIVL